MALLPHPARVRPYLGYRNATRLRLTARALRMREPGWEHNGTFRKLAAMMRQFASNEVPGLVVTLEVMRGNAETQSFTAVSDADGFVSFDVEVGRGTASKADPAWEQVRLHWTNRDGAQSVDAFVLAPGETDKLAVVSDVDDTIVETGAGDLWRNWRRVLAQMPGDREVVPGAATFYTRLSGGGGIGETIPATRRPFFYVSSSPWNLFDYLVAFQKLHKLPQGPILLRDWDLSRETFGSSGHKSHKARSIDGLLAFYPDMRFALIGDNTQADALAYAEVVARHAGRIAAVFIRHAPGADVSAEEQAAFDSIRAAGVSLWTGDSYAIGEDFLQSFGFTTGGETSKIVETIAKPDAVAAPADAPAGSPAAAPVDSLGTPA